MKKNGAEIIISFLEFYGIRTIVGIPGGANLPIYDALHKSRLRHILARHEQGAGFIAQGMARSTGEPAVCLATSGPGATNLLTAIADAYMDSVPVIAITGQVPTSLSGTMAFQEVDTNNVFKPVTKKSYYARNARELIEILPQAFRIAKHGRPGPVLIDVPKDVQLARTVCPEWREFEQTEQLRPRVLDQQIIDQISEQINLSRKPVCYIGGGIIHAGAGHVLYDFIQKTHIPLTSTLMGLGAFPTRDAHCIGMLGMHGKAYTNRIMREADLLIALGARFDDRATGKVQEFCTQAKIIHIDIDPKEINKIKPADWSITADVKQAMEGLIPRVVENDRRQWWDRVESIKRNTASIPSYQDKAHAVQYIQAIGLMSGPEAIITTDVGQHQMWVAQAYPFQHPRTLLTSGGLGTMGFGLPAAIGAALAHPHKKVICFTGDGSLLMNIQELATLAELNLNVTIVLMNNDALGLVRQQQELFYQKNYCATHFLQGPDFAAIAQNFGIKGVDLGEACNKQETLAESLRTDGPCLINIPIDAQDNVWPIVPGGKGNGSMLFESEDQNHHLIRNDR